MIVEPQAVLKKELAFDYLRSPETDAIFMLGASRMRLVRQLFPNRNAIGKDFVCQTTTV